MTKLSDKLSMKASESLSNLYQIIAKAINETAAHQAVNAAIGNIMHDIRDAGENVTSENIERRLEAYVKDYIEVAQKTHVA